MYSDVIKQIENITDQLLNNPYSFDFKLLPLDAILDVVSNAGDAIGENGSIIRDNFVVLLNSVSNAGDIDGFCAVLKSICIFLKQIDLIAMNARYVEYANLLWQRTPELLYYQNIDRNNKNRESTIEMKNRLFSGKGCVYTVIMGDYDEIREPELINENWDYILFTDNRNMKAQKWDVRYVDDSLGYDSLRLSRVYKILAHQYLSDYDYSIYVDGNIKIVGDLTEYIKTYSTGNAMICMNHYLNTDIYEEAELCIKMGKGSPELIEKQMMEYRGKGFPEKYGLTANGFIVRNHRNEKLIRVMQDWWNEYNAYPTRDQLSLMYCCWKNGFLYDTSPLNIEDNAYLSIECHSHIGDNDK